VNIKTQVIKEIGQSEAPSLFSINWQEFCCTASLAGGSTIRILSDLLLAGIKLNDLFIAQHPDALSY
jgi:hypothetical protein